MRHPSVLLHVVVFLLLGQAPVTTAFAPESALQVLVPQRNRATLWAALDPAITLENLSCSHDGGDTYQLDNVNFVLQRGAKAALIGRNGAGKSTLLKIIASATCPDHSDTSIRYSGQIVSPRDIQVALVEQEPPMLKDVTVADALLGIQGDETDSELLSSNPSVFAAVRRYRLACEHAEDDPEAFTNASAEMESLSGWAVLTKADEVATRLRVDTIMDQELATLSGGERKRVALAAALVQSPDLLLLDEPTNFLSLAGVSWLADLLTLDDKLTILMVSHDRAFLDDVCDRMVELEQGELYEYKGKYADYLQAKEERLAVEDAAVQSAKAKYRVELDWMRRQPQARQSKSKARIDAFYKLQQATRPRSRAGNVELVAGQGRRVGGKILSLKHVNLSFGDKVILNDFSYDFCKGDRICVTGANGCGKTTFIRVLTKELAPDSGQVERGDTVVLGVYDQLGIKIDEPDQTALEYVVSCVQAQEHTAGGDSSLEARKLLNRFEFPKQRWNDRVSQMSGGERRRLQLLEILSKRPNFLVLDEPSVDLDLQTIQSLEGYLSEFEGVLLVVSHDQFFANKVADHLFVFEGNGEIKDFQGSLSEYASALIELENTSYNQKTDLNPSKKANYKEDRAKRNEIRNAARRAKRDMDIVEKSLERLRVKAAMIQQEIDESGDEGWSVLADLSERLNQVKQDIEDKEMAWMELAELVEDTEIEV